MANLLLCINAKETVGFGVLKAQTQAIAGGPGGTPHPSSSIIKEGWKLDQKGMVAGRSRALETPYWAEHRKVGLLLFSE